MQKTYFEEKDSIWFPSMIRLFHWWITSAVNLDQVQFNQENDFFARDLEFSNQTFLRSMSKESLGHTLGTLPPHMISKKSKKWQMWLMIFDLWYMIFVLLARREAGWHHRCVPGILIHRPLLLILWWCGNNIFQLFLSYILYLEYSLRYCGINNICNSIFEIWYLTYSLRLKETVLFRFI